MPPPSKIAQLPAEFREWLHQAFVERAFGDIVAITDELNRMLEEADLPDRIGKSAVGAESQRVKRAQLAMKKTTELMQSFAETTRDDTDARGEVLNAKISTDMFQCLMEVMEADSMVDPLARLGVLKEASLTAARLTTSSVRQRKFRSEVEARAKEAADKVAKIAKKGGMDARTVAEIRSSILGIVKRPPASEGAAGG